MAKYLLPCSQCERTLEVDAGQAGQTVVCECGHRMEVPTMRGLSGLKRVETPAPAESTDWSKGNGLVLFGLILATAALLTAAYRYFTTEPVFEESRIREQVAELTPSQAWSVWESLESEGIDRPLAPQESEAIAQAAERARWTWVAVGVGVLGLALAALGFFIRPGPAARGKPTGKPARAPASTSRK